MKKRKKWTQAEDDYLRRIYPEMSNEEIAMWLHRSKRAVMAHAYILGVHKSPEFAEKQFKKGQFKKKQSTTQQRQKPQILGFTRSRGTDGKRAIQAW